MVATKMYLQKGDIFPEVDEVEPEDLEEKSYHTFVCHLNNKPRANYSFLGLIQKRFALVSELLTKHVPMFGRDQLTSASP